MTTRLIDGQKAVSELVTELDRSRRDYAKSQLALSQAEANALTLKENLASKDRLLAQLQQEIVERDSSHRMEVVAVAQGSEAHQQVADRRVQFLEAEVERLKKEVAVAGDYITQNQQLRTVLAQCHQTLSELQKANAELRAQMAKEVRSRTESLEAEFSKKLLESEHRLRQDAFNALSEESKVALAGNDKLQTVLQRQNETLDSVLERCRHLEAAQTKIEEERKLVETDASTQEREIQRLHRVLGDADDRTLQLEDALKQRRVERASFELLFVEYNTVKEEAEKLKEQNRRAVREAARWREKAFEMSDSLGADEQKDAIQKLHAITAHSDLLEKNAERNRRRKEKIQAAREKNARVAEAVTAFENGMENMPISSASSSLIRKNDYGGADDDERDEQQQHANISDEEESSHPRFNMGDERESSTASSLDGASLLPPRESKLKVSAMDILAIWNVNYESEDAGFFKGGNQSTAAAAGGPSTPPVFSSSGLTPDPDARQQQRLSNINNSSGNSNITPAQVGRKTSRANNNKPPPSSLLPPIQQQLRTDADRSAKDAKLSVGTAPRLPHSHNIRKLKESTQLAQARVARVAEVQNNGNPFVLQGSHHQPPS